MIRFHVFSFTRCSVHLNTGYKKCGNRYRGVGHRIISITLNEYIISFYAKPLSIAVAKLYYRKYPNVLPM
nr:MAG TPA: hypothetical protein [Caudoviricetes sp.]